MFAKSLQPLFHHRLAWVMALGFYLLSMAPGVAQSTLETLYVQDFSDCSEITFTNADDAGYTDYIDGINFECTLQGPSGPYNQWAGGDGSGSVAPSPNFTTADNGFLLVDSDLFGAEESYAASWVENCWVTMQTPADFTGYPFVTVEFENFYRCWDNTTDIERCYLELSLDGVNWPSPETLEEEEGVVVVDGEVVTARYEVFPTFERADQTENPYTARFDIGDVAGNQPTVYFRFRWVGQWGYSWMIDDLRAFETPDHDLRVTGGPSLTDFENTGLWEASVWPESQLPANGFDVAVGVTSMGSVAQTGVTLEITVNGGAAPSGASPETTLAYGQVDTLKVQGWLPQGVGEYALDFEVFADSLDQFPADNSTTLAMEVTEYHYGRDDGTFEGQTPAVGTVDFIAGVPYDVINPMTIYGIDVAIMDGSDMGAEVVCHLFDWSDWNNGGGQYDGLFASTIELPVNAESVNSGDGEPLWTTFTFAEPVELDAGAAVMACFEHLGGDNVQIGTSIPQKDQTAFIYGPFGGGSAYGWYFTTNCPMIRLNLDPEVGCLGCTDPTACNFDAGACGDNGTCVYAFGCDYCLGGSVADGDADNDGVCDVDEIAGCTDPAAWNFDPAATDSDPSSCIYVPQGCESIGNDNWNNLDLGVFPDYVTLMYAVPVTDELVLNVPQTMVEPGSGSLFAVQDFTLTQVEGLPEGVETDWPDAPMEGGNQACVTLSGTPSETGLFEVSWTGAVVLSLFGSSFPIGDFTFSQVIQILPNPNPIPGCTYSGASNFSPLANDDDGSCLIEGCTDPEADNYHPIFNADDGSCDYGNGGTGGNADCPSDLNGDNLIGVADLLILLGEFGIMCP